MVCTFISLISFNSYYQMEIITPYDILEIRQGSNEEQIKQAYKMQAMKWHPDKNPDQRQFAEQKFKDINDAYEKLTRVNPNTFNFNNLFNENTLGNMLNVVNSFQKPQQPVQKIGTSIIQEVMVTLDEIYSGTKKNVNFSRHIIDPKTPNIMCPKCQGRGELTIIQKLNDAMMTQKIELCQNCRGQGFTGIIINEDCQHEITITPGFIDGEMIIEKGQGNQLIGGAAGDLMVHVTTEKHKLFERKENDLYGKIKVSFKKAMLGFEYNLAHLDGTKVKVKVPGPIKIGKTKVIKGRGMPIGDKLHGDLYLDFHFNLPRKLNEEQIKAIKEHF